MIVDEPLAHDLLKGPNFLGLTWMEWTVYTAVVGRDPASVDAAQQRKPLLERNE